MESRAITDAQISASSQWDVYHAAVQGRLNFLAGGGKQGGWSARTNDQNQWLQADLGNPKKVTHFATQGRNAADQWVTSYKVEYSNDGASFQFYKEQGADKVSEISVSVLHMFCVYYKYYNEGQAEHVDKQVVLQVVKERQSKPKQTNKNKRKQNGRR